MMRGLKRKCQWESGGVNAAEALVDAAQTSKEAKWNN
jgi:hypothetical protein